MIHFDAFPEWFAFSKKDVSAWLILIADKHGRQIEQLNYRFLDEEDIREANRKYLNHDYPTDIITFGYKEGKVVAADIFIGYTIVAQNAEEWKTAGEEELLRVMAHGLLHLMGFNDTTPAESLIMKSEEEKCLLLRPENLRVAN